MTVWVRTGRFSAPQSDTTPTITGTSDSASTIEALLVALEDQGIIHDDTEAASDDAETVIISEQPTNNAAFDVQVDTDYGDGLRSRFRVENNDASQLVDINVRGASLNVGASDPAVSAGGTALLLFAPLGDTSNCIQVFKAGDGTTGTNTFRIGRNGNVIIACGGLATNAFVIKTAADAQNKYNITELGVVSWGPGGSTAPDTNLYRNAANQLKTDDGFVVSGTGSYITNPSLTTTQRDALGTAAAVGSTVWNTTDTKLQVKTVAGAPGTWVDLH